MFEFLTQKLENEVKAYIDDFSFQSGKLIIKLYENSLRFHIKVNYVCLISQATGNTLGKVTG